MDGQDFVPFTPHPLPSQGQALIFPIDEFIWVGINNKLARSCDFTPILAFPHQEGRDLSERFCWM